MCFGRYEFGYLFTEIYLWSQMNGNVVICFVSFDAMNHSEFMLCFALKTYYMSQTTNSYITNFQIWLQFFIFMPRHHFRSKSKVSRYNCPVSKNFDEYSFWKDCFSEHCSNEKNKHFGTNIWQKGLPIRSVAFSSGQKMALRAFNLIKTLTYYYILHKAPSAPSFDRYWKQLIGSPK